MQIVRSAGHIAETKIAPQTEGLAGWLLARFGMWQRRAESKQKQMRVEETLSLGGRRQLMLVLCAGERYLVGGGPDSVETIVRVTGQGLLSKEQSQ
jgi:flagellar biogenesis protein FliO